MAGDVPRTDPSGTSPAALRARPPAAEAEIEVQYYRELIDLCWTEFRLWQAGLLDYYVFYAWILGCATERDFLRVVSLGNLIVPDDER
jgi:hypothetical protein